MLVNELNTMPGFTETSVYGKLWAASGVPYAEVLDRLAASRSSATAKSTPTGSDQRLAILSLAESVAFCLSLPTTVRRSV